MAPLPDPLAQAFAELTAAGGKRERTQGQLLQAAMRVVGAKGVAAATVQDVAQAAGMTPATVYNHFETKEALLQRLATAIAETLCRVIDDSYAHVTDAAERMAIGQRRYVWLAAQNPGWVLALLDVFGSSPEALRTIEQYPLADLRLGVKQRKFKVPSEAAAMDAISGICTHAMRRVALGLAPPRHDIATAALVLRALGLAPAAADEVARRPLPPLAPPPAAAPRAVAKRARRV